MEVLQENNLAGVTFVTPNKTNGLDQVDYCLSVDAAKFVVARWSNSIGAGYLTYLIKLDSQKPKYNSLDIMKMMLKEVSEQSERIDKVSRRVDAVLDLKNQFPEDCLRIEKINAKYFPGIARTKVSAYLNAIGHSKGVYTYRDEYGLVVQSKPFKNKGLDEAAEKFYSERELVDETPKLRRYVHPVVGFHQERKLKAKFY